MQQSKYGLVKGRSHVVRRHSYVVVRRRTQCERRLTQG